MEIKKGERAKTRFTIFEQKKGEAGAVITVAFKCNLHLI